MIISRRFEVSESSESGNPKAPLWIMGHRKMVSIKAGSLLQEVGEAQGMLKKNK